MVNTHDKPRKKRRQFAGLTEQRQTSTTHAFVSDKEEVPGSSPGRPTNGTPHFAGKTWYARRGPGVYRAFAQQRTEGRYLRAFSRAATSCSAAKARTSKQGHKVPISSRR